LGHINTFGGHPVSCAAGLAGLKVLLEENIIQEVKRKEQLFLQHLHHPLIKKVNSFGLMIAVHFDSFATTKKIIDKLIERGVFTDWFLFASNALRIAPALNISDEEIVLACEQIKQVLNDIQS
jgi:acetylornithine/N-succinyldiaminopimelate aminotransferase